MKKSLIISLIPVLVIACGPKQKETKYPDGSIKERFEYTIEDSGSELKNGAYSGFHPNGQLLSKGEYIKNEKDGEWTEWYSDGSIKKKYTMKNGLKNGVYISLKESGDSVAYITYKNGLMHGEKRSYFKGSGNIFSIENFKKDTIEGKQTSFHENGNLRRVNHVKNQKWVGEFISYYENGNVEEKKYYNEENKLTGEEIEYFENGETQKIRPYKNGKRHGIYKEWNEKGDLIKEMEWIEDENISIQGKWKADNGTIYDFNDEGIVTTSSNGRKSKKSYSIGSAVIKISYNRHNLLKFIDGEMQFEIGPVLFGDPKLVTATKL